MKRRELVVVTHTCNGIKEAEAGVDDSKLPRLQTRPCHPSTLLFKK